MARVTSSLSIDKIIKSHRATRITFAEMVEHILSIQTGATENGIIIAQYAVDTGYAITNLYRINYEAKTVEVWYTQNDIVLDYSHTIFST